MDANIMQYNLTNSNLIKDVTTTKTVAGGSANYDIDLSNTVGFSVQVVYDDTDAADDTWILYGSDDGTNFYVIPGALTITSTITAVAVTDGWQSVMLKSRFLRVAFTKGSSTTGTYKIILTTRGDV